MKKRITSALLVSSLSVALGTSCLAQSPFNSCSAAFVGGRMVVDAYTPAGKCQLPATATGTLTVQTVALTPTSGKAVDPIDFRVAIRDKSTGTLHQFSNETYRKVPVERVLSRCKKGDRIVLLTIDDRYALPHNEILVR
ncbi:hypothetical protein [Fibrivirga algicola]|uniref:DUF5666 domain-containing protein n=1 Tax=Fibrivirga algicola TaxID=2950420 RepID=A0ABX0QEB9_9BACT|nr:hypothetical protein [Fibrivirga algicola]ARK11123.1 hypothetical protein A6C57_12755 [Fibrella sp. ES10-3-2-2]NID09606.1 hypothetical protein [Fibrivirga algicola]